MLRSRYLWFLVLAPIGALTLAVLFDFTADDAFIVLRYAQNLTQHGVLEYNWGEPINALTSPLHAFLMAALNLLTLAPILANKLVGILALLATLIIGWRSIGAAYSAAHGRLAGLFQILFVVMVGVSPFVGLWTVGGLETPYVMLLITSLTALVSAAAHGRGVTPLQTLLIGALIGIAFLGRFDTALFTMPIVVWLLMQSRKRPWIFAALVPGALPAVVWLVFSFAYYHDVLPTSFYTKTPTFIPGILAKDAAYTLEFLVLSGLLSIALPPLALAYKFRAARAEMRQEILRVWPLWLGVAFIGAYAQTTATAHMMFGFRMFLPYLPAAILLIFGLWPATRAQLLIGRRAVAAFAGIMLAAQAALTFIVHSYSANPVPGHIAEFSHQSKTAFMQGDLKTLIASTDDIKAHWALQPASQSRGPRIVGPAAGIVPMRIPDAYVYEVLASARHKCTIEAKYYGDYVQIISPRMGTPESDFPAGWTEANIISRRPVILDGEIDTVIVYFNPDPRPNILPPYIDQPCLSPPSQAAASAE